MHSFHRILKEALKGGLCHPFSAKDVQRGAGEATLSVEQRSSRSTGVPPLASQCACLPGTKALVLRASFEKPTDSGANTAAIKQYNRDENKHIKIRQCKYLNNIVEHDHRFIKRPIRPMLGFKSFQSARATVAGVELWRMLKKGQNKSSLPAWQQFYELALTG